MIQGYSLPDTVIDMTKVLTSVVVSVSVMSMRVVVSRALSNAVIPASSTAGDGELSDVASCRLV